MIPDSISEEDERLMYGDLSEFDKIQAQGYVIGVVRENGIFKVISISDNLIHASWFKADKDLLINNSIENVFGNQNTIRLTQSINNCFPLTESNSKVQYRRGYTLINYSNDNDLDGSSPQQQQQQHSIILCCTFSNCKAKDNFVLEIENVEMSELSQPNFSFYQSHNIIQLIQNASNIESVLCLYCDNVMKMMPEFDRGIAYRFDDDGSGKVIYENIRDTSFLKNSFLQHHFHSTDIPIQIRAMSMKYILRYIYDVNGPTYAMLGAKKDQNLDLTMCYMRGVHHYHLEYLQNMGVVCSMTIAIVVNQKLWGSYNFHSYKQHTKPNFEKRLMLEMLASVSAMKMHSFIQNDISTRKLKMNELLFELDNQKSIYDFIETNKQELLNILQVDAISIYPNSNETDIHIYGDSSIVPNDTVSLFKIILKSSFYTLLAYLQFNYTNIYIYVYVCRV
jgi:light-regulated signal transduction histidine kinase (bacteriophytochrome)